MPDYKTPRVLTWFFPMLTWRVRTKEKVVFLTFDDGPIPEVTPWVVDRLRKYNIKATFFCVGENVEKHPQIFKMLTDNGHAVGNHTFNHVKYFKADKTLYIDNVDKAQKLINTELFRPPHGQIGYGIARLLLKKFNVVMWDILTGDYDMARTPEECFGLVKQHVRPGSVIVFHDSIKAEKNVKAALPMTIEYLLNEGWRFEILNKNTI
jgi:peptidoglycan-N-acetylglucosamine deacetylase